MSARYIVGDVFDTLATLEPDSVDLVFSSPPFLALRSYLPADHEHKAKEIGSEATPADFLDTLLDVVEACDRVLAPHGSLCFELGDTFAGGGDGKSNGWVGYDKGDSDGFHGYRKTDGTATLSPGGGPGWPDAKSLCLIPTLFAASLAYGYNMLRPERTTPRWRVRNLVVWARPNPPVGALGDKWRPATSYVTVACKSTTRFFDLDAVRGSGLASQMGEVSKLSLACGAAFETPLGAPAVGAELAGTVDAGNGPNPARWWCDLSEAQVTVDRSMARDAEGLEIRELVGLRVGIETAEGPKVMDLESCRGSATLAGVPVAVERSLPGFLPRRPSVVDSTATVGGACLASPVGRAPLPVAIEAAEVVSLDGAWVAEDRLAARLTLKVDASIVYALLVAPVASAHVPNLTAGYDTQGAPPLDYLILPTSPYPGSHYATFSPKLVVPFLKSMTPHRVCRVCGEPSRRIVENPNAGAGSNHWNQHGTNGAKDRAPNLTWDRPHVAERETFGWTDCGCCGVIQREEVVDEEPEGLGILFSGPFLADCYDESHWRPGTVLDPFAGSGTTLAVATGHGRDAIGIDLDERNADLALERVGPLMLTVEHLNAEPAA